MGITEKDKGERKVISAEQDKLVNALQTILEANSK